MTGTASEGPPPSAPIRIAYLVGRELGATERQITDLVLALEQTRFETRVCCLSTGGPTIGPCATSFARAPIPTAEQSRARATDRG